MTNVNFVAKEADGTSTLVTSKKQGTSVIIETVTNYKAGEEKLLTITRKSKAKKSVNLKAEPRQTEDTPKTKRRYLYVKTGNFVCYARAKQLGIVK